MNKEVLIKKARKIMTNCLKMSNIIQKWDDNDYVNMDIYDPDDLSTFLILHDELNEFNTIIGLYGKLDNLEVSIDGLAEENKQLKEYIMDCLGEEMNLDRLKYLERQLELKTNS